MGRCAYSLFGAVASVVKVGMGTELVAMLVDLMLKSIQNTDGISLEMEENDTNTPLEDLSDEEDIESNADDTDRALDDLEGVKSVNVENSFMAEKECAVIALKDLSVECGVAFHPFLSQCVEEISNLLDHPEYDVRCAAIEASAFFLIAYHKAGTPEGTQKFKESVQAYLNRLVDYIVEEEEHQVVIAALDAMTELLKQCKNAVTEGAGHCEIIVGCVQKIMKGVRRRRPSRTRCCSNMREKFCPTLAVLSHLRPLPRTSPGCCPSCSRRQRSSAVLLKGALQLEPLLTALSLWLGCWNLSFPTSCQFSWR